MNDEAPRLSYILVPILTLGLIGFALGSYVGWDTEYKKLFSLTGAIAGGFMGWLVSRWLIGRREDFFYYEYNMSLNALPESQKAFSGTVVLSLKLEDGSSKEIHGLTKEEWTQLGKGVRVDNGYSTRILAHIFGAGRGGTIYEIMTDILKDKRVKVLHEKGTGVEITEKGWRFFAHLEKGEYEILNMLPDSLPFPAREQA